MKISVPATDRRKALIVVDVQPALLAPSILKLVPFMANFIDQTTYDFYAEATWFSDEQSTFYLQAGDLFSVEDVGETAPEILAALARKGAPTLSLQKRTRSAFQSLGDNSISDELKGHEIEEVHLFGVDINDCVFATAMDAADAGFYTYVIEELSHHSEASSELREAALALLRYQRMTNNSLKPGISSGTLGLFL